MPSEKISGFIELRRMRFSEDAPEQDAIFLRKDDRSSVMLLLKGKGFDVSDLKPYIGKHVSIQNGHVSGPGSGHLPETLRIGSLSDITAGGEWQRLRDYFQQNAGVQINADAADQHVFEDPRDPASIIAINLLIRPGTSEQKLRDTARKIQDILDQNKIVAIASPVGGAADCTGIQILSEQPMPKSLGIRSEFDGVPVGFAITHSLDAFKRKPSAPKGPAI